MISSLLNMLFLDGIECIKTMSNGYPIFPFWLLAPETGEGEKEQILAELARTDICPHR